MPSADTIFALSSAPGMAGVAVIRISGPAAASAAGLFGIGRLEPRHARLARISSPATGEPIDQCLAIRFPGPNSFTGEDILELHVHGGRAVIAATLNALSQMPGLRLAEAGEFTRRAFHNGKLDLTEAEGLAALLAAETEVQRRQALQIANGALRDIYETWRHDLIGAMSLIEAALDFSDEGDVADTATAQARQQVAGLRSQIGTHLNDGRRGEILRDGLKVVLAGPPNAGKSSLLNALARRDVAIVSPEAGTTRDIVEARLDLGGYPVIVSDTAGIRGDATSPIELEGIRRSLARSAESDIVLWLTDCTAPMVDPPENIGGDGASLVLIRNKCDLLPNPPAISPGVLAISTRTGQGLATLIDRLGHLVRSRLATDGGPAVSTARQRALLVDTCQNLDAFLAGKASAPELRAEDLRLAARSIGRLTGRVDVEDVLDRVFSAFCIGK